MVAIEHRSKSSTTTLLSPSSASTSSQSTTSVNIPTTKATNETGPNTTATVPTATTTTATKTIDDNLTINKNNNNSNNQKNIKTKIMSSTASAASSPTTVHSLHKKSHQQQQQKDNNPTGNQEMNKRMLKLDLNVSKDHDDSLKSPKSPIVGGRMATHQTSLVSAVDVEDRKTLREALYQGIFHRHRRTIFAVGSFLRMLRSRNSQYNTIRSSTSENDEEIR